MKLFETPTIDVEKLYIADVIATSYCDSDCSEYDECETHVCPLD